MRKCGILLINGLLLKIRCKYCLSLREVQSFANQWTFVRNRLLPMLELQSCGERSGWTDFVSLAQVSLNCVGKYWATNLGFYVLNSQNEESARRFCPRPTVDSQGWRWVPRFKGPAEGFRLYHSFLARRHFPKDG